MGLIYLMELTTEELKEMRVATMYYMQHHISIKNPRYKEYEVILQKLSKSICEFNDHNN